MLLERGVESNYLAIAIRELNKHPASRPEKGEKMIKMNRSQVKRLIDANQHANIIGVLEFRISGERDADPMALADSASVTAEVTVRSGEYGEGIHAYAWGGDDGSTADPFVRRLDRLAVAHNLVEGDNEVLSVSRACCGYGSEQAAIQYMLGGIAVAAETCGGHSVAVYISRKGDVTVLDTDGEPSEQNWADIEEDEADTSADDRRKRRMAKLNAPQ